MTHSLPLKAALKRGALIAAANWPLVAVQFIAEATLKLLLAVPTIGGLFLVVLLLGADVDDVLAGNIRDIVGTVFGALRANPIALAAFAVAFVLVLLGGSALTFIVKGGTVAMLAAAEASAGPIERPPVRLEAVRRAEPRAHRSVPRRLPAAVAAIRAPRRLPADRVCASPPSVYLAFIVGGYALAEARRSCSAGRWSRRWRRACSWCGSR